MTFSTIFVEAIENKSDREATDEGVLSSLVT